MRNPIRKRNIVSNMRPAFITRTALIGFSVFALAGTAVLIAQDPPPSPASQDKADQSSDLLFRKEVRQVQAPVTVLDGNGRIVNGLSALDFTLYDNGKVQQITEDMVSHPISLVVAIQANAGMEKILPQIRKTASLFDTLVSGQDGEVAVLAFDHRVQTLTNFTSDPDQIKAAFSANKLRAGSYTSALNDATMAAINMLRNRPSNRKRILVLVAENRDGGSGLHVRDVLTNAEFSDVEIYPVDVSQIIEQLTGKPMANRPDPIPPGGEHLPGGNVMTPTLEVQNNQLGNWVPLLKDIYTGVKSIFVPNPLTVYAHYTGARQFKFFTQKGLEQAIDDIGQELHNQYILTYTPNDQAEGGYHTIRVDVDKPGLKIIAREGYWQAAKPNQ